MKIHLRCDGTQGSHTRLTVFVDGQNSGQLCVSPAQAVWLVHVMSEGTTALSPRGRTPIEFWSSGVFPEPTGQEMEQEVAGGAK